MKGMDYLKRLSLAARWCLPQREASELIDDYRDILSDLPEGKDPWEMFGAPMAFVSSLSDPKSLRRWHIALCFMLFCALFPPISYALHDFSYVDGGVFYNLMVCVPLLWLMLEVIWSRTSSPNPLSFLAEIVAVGVVVVLFLCNPAEWSYWRLIFNLERVTNFNFPFIFTPDCFCVDGLPLLAGVVALCSLGLRNRLKKPMSKPLVVGVVLMFLAVAGIFAFTIYIWKFNIYILQYFGGWLYTILRAAVLVFTLLAPVSILLAKMYDRRWRAIFILSLAGMAMCFDLIQVATRMDWSVMNEVYLEKDARVMIQMFSQYTGVGIVLALLGLL